MENKLLWLLTLVVLFLSGIGIYRKAFAGERRIGSYCQFQASGGYPSQNGQCFMDEVVVGVMNGYVYCTRPTVYCVREAE